MVEYVKPELPDGAVAMLAGSLYDAQENAIFLKFYEPVANKMYLWQDRTGYRPHCFTKMEFGEQAHLHAAELGLQVERVEKRDVIEDKVIDVLEITGDVPSSISGGKGVTSIKDKVTCWETDLRHHDGYLAHHGLVVGLYYRRQGEQIVKHVYPLSDAVTAALQKNLWDKLNGQ